MSPSTIIAHVKTNEGPHWRQSFIQFPKMSNSRSAQLSIWQIFLDSIPRDGQLSKWQFWAETLLDAEKRSILYEYVLFFTVCSYALRVWKWSHSLVLHHSSSYPIVYTSDKKTKQNRKKYFRNSNQNQSKLREISNQNTDFLISNQPKLQWDSSSHTIAST